MTSTIGNERNPFSTQPFDSQISATNAALATVREAVGDGPGRNRLINGGFDVWQRALTQTSSGYGSDDRWANANTGSTKTVSQQLFPLGQTDVPGNPKYFKRTIVSSVAGAGNLVNTGQCIEDVTTLAGKTATLTFWAKADAGRNITAELSQNFGTGGSPSTTVTGISPTTFSLSTAWQKFSVLVNVPSVAGKTLGTAGDYLALIFWFDAGTSFNSRTNSLGQQSGTFDIARVSLVEGDATLESDPFSPRHIQQELALCQRYYEIGYSIFSGNVTTGSAYYVACPFKVVKRTTPNVTGTDISNGSFPAGLPVFAPPTVGQTAVRGHKTAAGTGNGFFEFLWIAEAEL